MEEIIKTNKGRTLKQISKGRELFREKCYFVYEHSYNSISKGIRIIPAIFIKYAQRNKDYAIIKREDCKNRSRVPMNQVYMEEKVKCKK